MILEAKTSWVLCQIERIRKIKLIMIIKRQIFILRLGLVVLVILLAILYVLFRLNQNILVYKYFYWMLTLVTLYVAYKTKTTPKSIFKLALIITLSSFLLSVIGWTLSEVMLKMSFIFWIVGILKQLVIFSRTTKLD